MCGEPHHLIGSPIPKLPSHLAAYALIVCVGVGSSSQRNKTVVCGAGEVDADTSQFTLVGDE